MDGEQPSIAQPKHVDMQAQNGFGGYGKLIVTGLINSKDNKATEKNEQLVLDSCSGLAHYPKMGAYSYTLPSVFEYRLTANQDRRGSH